MSFKRVAAVSAAFFMFTFWLWAVSPAQASFERECRPPLYFKENLAPAEKIVAHLVGTQANRFMQIYNAVPPTTVLPGDEILVLSKDGVPNVAILRFVAGCFQDYGVHSRKLADWLLKHAVGQAL